MNVSSYDPMAAKKRKMVYYLCGYACALAIVLSVIENAKKGVRVVGRQPFQRQDKTRQILHKQVLETYTRGNTLCSMLVAMFAGQTKSRAGELQIGKSAVKARLSQPTSSF